MNEQCDDETDHEHAWVRMGVWTLNEFADPKVVFSCFECGAWTTWPLDRDDHIHIRDTEVLD